jgi:hypothetical protein
MAGRIRIAGGSGGKQRKGQLRRRFTHDGKVSFFGFQGGFVTAGIFLPSTNVATIMRKSLDGTDYDVDNNLTFPDMEELGASAESCVGTPLAQGPVARDRPAPEPRSGAL